MKDQNLFDWIWLNRLPASFHRKVLLAAREGFPAGEIKRRVLENFLDKHESVRKIHETFDPEEELRQAGKLGICILAFDDTAYPFLLKQIQDPPILLYMKGQILPADQASVAVVGTRHPSYYGAEQAQIFSKDLASRGLTLVSGMAQGIDQIAHKAALSVSFGRTLAVLGCGLDRDYPSGCEDLRGKIAERGALISEFALGTPPLSENFPRRNRIISALSLGVLVVEAHSRSGSLITARLAGEQGREVFAIPGPVNQLTSRGSHALIKEGAALVESPEEVFQILEPALKRDLDTNHKESLPKEVSPEIEILASESDEVTPSNFSKIESELIKNLSQPSGLSYDELLHTLHQYPASEIMSALTLLEMKRQVLRNPGGRFCLSEPGMLPF